MLNDNCVVTVLHVLGLIDSFTYLRICLPAATASPTALPANVVGLGVSGRATPTGVGSLDSIGSVSTTPVHASSIRPASPSPSLASSDRGGGVGVEGESAGERSEKEEEDRRRRQQLYVFVMRCIAYPFNAKQPTDMARRQVKVNRSQLATIRERFQVCLCTIRHDK